MDVSAFSMGFGVGVVCGFFLTVVALRDFERRYPSSRPPIDGRAPMVKRKAERKKPVVIDEFKEYQREQEQLKGRDG